MKFALIQEGDFGTEPGVPRRYHEMVREVQLAERMGFDTYCLSEQHFLKDICTVSSPEVFLAHVGALTEKIRLRITSAVLLTFNHPTRIAERLTTLDILSNGRAELGTARSNNLNTLQGFGVSPNETRAQWTESMDVIMAALTRDEFEYHGKYWELPPRYLSPRSVQTPHPPIYVSSTSLETHENVGRRGLGVMTGNSILGWDYAEQCIAAYNKGIANPEPYEGSKINNTRSFFVAVAHCAEDMALARKEAENVTRHFVDFVIWLFGRLGSSSPEYQYFSQIKKIEERKDDLAYVVDSVPYFMIGSPEYIIERLERLASLGVDEVLLRIDGMGHEVNLRSIETFGSTVIPHFKSKQR